jgi:DivIVA domain-containing protein
MPAVNLLFVLMALALVGAVALVAVGRGDAMTDARPDRAPMGLPDGPLRGEDLECLRFSGALRGYRMDQVDAVLDRLRDELDRLRDEVAARDLRIAELEARPWQS